MGLRFAQYVKELQRIKPLAREEEAQLWQAYKAGGEEDARRQLIEAYQPLVFKQAQYLILHFGGGEIDPSMMMHEDEHDNLYAVKMTVRGKDVFIGDERLAKLLPKLQKRKREILLMYYLLDMTLEEIANELGIEYETVKSTKSKAIKELRKGAASESEEA